MALPMSTAVASMWPVRLASRRALVAIVVGVSLVHAAGWWAWRAGPTQVAPRAAQFAPGWQVRMVTRPAGGPDEAVLPAARLGLPQGLEQVPHSVPDALPEKPATGTPSGIVPAPGWHPTAFRPADELDVVPTPETGWWLDEALLQQQGRARLTLALWVSDQGQIVQWRLLHAEPPGDWVARALTRLPDTPMRPGQRHGQPQAAHLVIEIASDDESYR